MPDPLFYRDFAYVFVAALLGGVVAWRLGLPLILGYVFGGILISPLTPGPAVSDIRTFELFAEIGVILLMFSIGLEFSLRDLMGVKLVAIVGGAIGMLSSIGLALGVGMVLGWGTVQALVIGMVVSVSSTMVVAKLLVDRGDLHARHGRIMMGIVLVEDLGVVVLIVLIPRLDVLETGRLLTVGGGLVLAVAILAPFLYIAAKVIPAVLTRVARTRNDELFLLVTLAVALGTAALTQAAGLSLALGAFLVGLIINQSDYAHEALARLLPLRDAFVALFFVTMGALLDPRALLEDPTLLAIMFGLVVVGKLVTRAGLVWLARQPLWTAVLVGLGLAQIGEFSFVLVQVARAAGHVGEHVYHATLAVSLLSILANGFLVRRVGGWVGGVRVASQREPATGLAHGHEHHVVLCGFGRVGSAVGEALETFKVPYVVIERDPDIVRGLRTRSIASLYGDASHRGVLDAAAVGRAALIVVALPDIAGAERAVRQARALNQTAAILARAEASTKRELLIEAGASEVIQPELEAASTLIRHALRCLALPRDRVLGYLDRFRAAMDLMPRGGAPTGEAFPEVREVTVGGAGIADHSLRAARVRERFGVTVLVVRRADGEVLMHPSADTVLRRGDRVTVFGLPDQIGTFLGELPGGGA